MDAEERFATPEALEEEQRAAKGCDEGRGVMTYTPDEIRAEAEWMRKHYESLAVYRDGVLKCPELPDMTLELVEELERLEQWQTEAMIKHNDLLPELTPEQLEACKAMDGLARKIIDDSNAKEAEFIAARSLLTTLGYRYENGVWTKS